MSRALNLGRKGLFVVTVAAALGFGTTQAFAGVAVAKEADRCTDWCRARYSICISQGGPNCYQEREACLESCTI
jgi:hypothetical protein